MKQNIFWNIWILFLESDDAYTSTSTSVSSWSRDLSFHKDTPPQRQVSFVFFNTVKNFFLTYFQLFRPFLQYPLKHNRCLICRSPVNGLQKGSKSSFIYKILHIQFGIIANLQQCLLSQAFKFRFVNVSGSVSARNALQFHGVPQSTACYP